MVKNRKRFVTLVASLLLACATVVSLCGTTFAHTTSTPSDDLYVAGAPASRIEIEYADKVVTLNIGDMFQSYNRNGLTSGTNLSVSTYDVDLGIDNVVVDVNYSIQNLVTGVAFFCPRVRILNTSDYFDYDDLIIRLVMEDYTIVSDTTMTHITDVSPRIYTSKTGLVAEVDSKWVGGTVEVIDDVNYVDYVGYTTNRDVPLTAGNYTLISGDYGVTDYLPLYRRSTATSLPYIVGQYAYIERLSVEIPLDTTSTTSVGFCLPIQSFYGLDPSITIDPPVVTDSMLVPSVAGSYFWRVGNLLGREYQRDVIEVEVTPDLTGLASSFFDLFNVEFFPGVTLGGVIIVPLSVLVVLAIMRKFAGG